MKFYVKSDRHVTKWLIFITILADIMLLFFGIQENTFLISGCIALALTLIIAVGLILNNMEGLLVDGDTLCYKAIRKKFYHIHDVKGLHIVKAQILIGRGLLTWDLKNRYVIIYLKDRDFVWNEHEGSFDFMVRHRKHILFTTTYDETAIAYFKAKNIPITGCI